MGKFLSADSRFSEVMRHVIFFIVTNVLWLLCCLPVITFFWSSSALFDCIRTYDRTGDPDAWRRFFPALRRDWKQGLLGGVVLTAALALLLLSAYSLAVTDFPFRYLSGAGIVIVSVVWLCTAAYFPALLSQFENSTWGLLKISCLIGLRHLLTTVAVLLIAAASVLLCSMSGYLLPVWSFGGFSLTAYGMNMLYRRVLVKYGAKGYTPRGFRLSGGYAGAEAEEERSESEEEVQ